MPAAPPPEFSRAILHVDADSFFASCEVAKDPALRGRAVITGLERGIVSSLTYEAKARGISRAMPLGQVRRLCPDAVILPSDYETYSLYSARMFNILRRFSPAVEEYGIDEGFSDLTGWHRPLGLSYNELVRAIKESLDRELGLTFSVGLAATKVLAKIGSKWKKPSGLTVIPPAGARAYLEKLPLAKVWGIGPQTAASLARRGLYTAHDLARQEELWARAFLAKPQYEIWQELNGQPIYAVDSARKQSYQSISKTRTFTPPSRNAEFVFSQLSKNIENAAIKMRRYHLAADKGYIFLKTQAFSYYGREIVFFRPTDNPVEIIRQSAGPCRELFRKAPLWRATGIVLGGLRDSRRYQADLFSETMASEKISRVFREADRLAERYGKHTLFLGSSLLAMQGQQHEGERLQAPARRAELFSGENGRQRLGLPFLGSAS